MADREQLLAGKSCLVLEDEFLIALDIQDIFEAAGAARVTCIGNADEALRALRAGNKFDLAVLDVNLGGATRDSFSVAAALAVQKTPFVFLTGMQRDTALPAGYAYVPVVEKPYQQADVLDAIRRVIAGQ